MNPSHHILEIALFTVKEAYQANLATIREAVRTELLAFEGLLSFECFEPLGDGLTFADLARWESLEHAQVAAAAFANGDFRFLPYIDAIEAIHFMGHFKPQVFASPVREAV